MSRRFGRLVGLVAVASVAMLSCGGLDARWGDQPTELKLRVVNGDLASVKMLIDSGVDVNETGGDAVTPLSLAVQYGHAEVAHSLIEAGAGLVVPGQNRSYVSLAAGLPSNRLEAERTEERYTAVVGVLLAAGVDPCQKDVTGSFAGLLPNEIARRQGRHDLAAMLDDAIAACT